MAKERDKVFVPALVGGLAAGVLSALPVANCFCCLWIIAGAVLAVYLYVRDSSQPVSSSDGLLLGLLTGLMATLIDFFLSIPFQAMNLAFARRFLETMAQFTEEMPLNWEDWLKEGPIGRFSFPLAIFTLMIRAIIFAALGAIGGAIGASLFGRRPKKPPAPPVSISPPNASRENIPRDDSK